MTKILVLGATGHVGRPLVRQLVASGHQVKAASRSGTPLAGAEAIRFDYADPSTFGPAFEEVDRAYLLLPSGYVNVKAMLEPVVRFALERGVKVVLQSVFGVDADDSIPYRQIERILEASGGRWVILRPNWFSDNFHTFWAAGIEHGVIALPAGQGKSSFIDVRDIAASAAAALTSDRFDGRAFNLTGPKALSYEDAASILSRVTGRPIRYTPNDDRAFVDALTTAGVPADYAGFLAGIFEPVREGWTAKVSEDVRTLTGAPPRSLERYATDHASELA